jgi:hypothetical protein
MSLHINAGRPVVLGGDDVLRGALLPRLPHAQTVALPSADAQSIDSALRAVDLSAGAAVLPLFQREPASPQAAAVEAYALIELLSIWHKLSGAWPARAVVLVGTPVSPAADAGRAILRTLLRYTTADQFNRPLSCNVVQHGAHADQLAHAADTTLALLSGALDDMRGQYLALNPAR